MKQKPPTNPAHPASFVKKPLMIGRTALGKKLLERFGGDGWSGWTMLENNEFLFDRLTVFAWERMTRFNRMSGLDRHLNGYEPEEEMIPGEIEAGADLIVDVSGDAKVRGMLGDRRVARCASMFVAPDGGNAVFMLEDKKRRLKLDRIEMQYLRWLICREIDDEYGDGGARVERGGKGGDAAASLSPRSLAVHTEAFRLLLLSRLGAPEAALLVRTPHRGDGRRKTIHAVKLKPSLVQIIHGWRILWDMGVEVKMLEMRNKEIPLETAGVLMGCVDAMNKTIYWVDVLPAPEDSTLDGCLFTMGYSGIDNATDTARRRTGADVRPVGVWRSHPFSLVAIPGEYDFKELERARDKMGVKEHPPLVLIIGENDLRFFPHMFEEFFYEL